MSRACLCSENKAKELNCAFVFAYAKSRFSHDLTHLFNTLTYVAAPIDVKMKLSSKGENLLKLICTIFGWSTRFSQFLMRSLSQYV